MGIVYPQFGEAPILMRSVTFLSLFVFLCIVSKADEISPDWTKRYHAIEQSLLTNGHIPKVGDTVTLVPRIGRPVTGRIDGIAKNLVLVEGRTFHASELTDETCDVLFGDTRARKAAQAQLQSEIDQYNRRRAQVSSGPTPAALSSPSESKLTISATSDPVAVIATRPLKTSFDDQAATKTEAVKSEEPTQIDVNQDGKGSLLRLVSLLTGLVILCMLAAKSKKGIQSQVAQSQQVSLPATATPATRQPSANRANVWNRSQADTLSARRAALSVISVIQPREAKRRQRELEKQAKGKAKLTALEQAKLEVDTFNNELDVLLSIHKDVADSTDWLGIANLPPPIPPIRQSNNTFRERLRFAAIRGEDNNLQRIEQARAQDDTEFQTEQGLYEKDYAVWQHENAVARRILNQDHTAYISALELRNPFAELSILGSALRLTAHSPKLIECVIRSQGRQAIPAEVKTLTSTGKLSVKPMPKQRFIEIYQDYVCGCILRVARDIFACLPIDTLLMSATVEAVDGRTGHPEERPIISAIVNRAELLNLDFDKIDPSEAVLGFEHRGKLKALRSTGEFEYVYPLTPLDIQKEGVSLENETLMAAASRLRKDIANRSKALIPTIPSLQLTTEIPHDNPG